MTNADNESDSEWIANLERVPMNWIVDENGSPSPMPSGMPWARWMHEHGQPGGLRVVGRDEWADGTYLSTIFLGVDMSFGMGPGVYWESMLFYPAHDHRERPQQRYSSQRDALAGHDEMLAEVLAEPEDHGAITYSERWQPPELRVKS